MTEFAMVEELASLIKDNLPCKHLVLSMEEMLVDLLQDDTRDLSNGPEMQSEVSQLLCSRNEKPAGFSLLEEVLELEPMNPYARLLLHRLADIFGFSHQSTGEGDDRHLILRRCQESSIPSILVGDLLWEYDEYKSPTSSKQISRIQEASPKLKPERHITQISLEEREAAYLAARERIFSIDSKDAKILTREKPRQNPVVARRMIAHALGHKVGQSDQSVSPGKSIGYGIPPDDIKIHKEDVFQESPEIRLEACISAANVLQVRPKVANTKGIGLLDEERKVPQDTAAKTFSKFGNSGARKHGTITHKDNMKEEHIGAAKRMFAHALGIHSTRDTIMSKSNQMKQTNK